MSDQRFMSYLMQFSCHQYLAPVARLLIGKWGEGLSPCPTLFHRRTDLIPNRDRRTCDARRIEYTRLRRGSSKYGSDVLGLCRPVLPAGNDDLTQRAVALVRV